MSFRVLPSRKRQWLPGFDYSQAGAYFVTVCTLDRKCLFGEIQNGVMRPNSIGSVVEQCWRELPMRFDAVTLDAFVLMPNHIHALLALAERARITLPEVMRVFKSPPAHHSRSLRGEVRSPLWQRGYFERIVRDAADLDRIRD